MNLPFVSRLRLEMAQQEIAHKEQEILRLSDRLAELKDANETIRKLYDEEKESRRQAEANAVEAPDTTASRRRVFGVDVMRKATEARRLQALQDGKLKR